MGWLLDGILDWITNALLTALDAVLSAIAGSLLISPDVTILPQVTALAGRSTWIVDSVFVLAFLAAGVTTMAAGGNERARYTAKDLMPRLIVGFVAAHFSQLLCSQAIGIANALTDAVGADTPGGAGAFTAMRAHVGSAASGQATGLLFVVILAIIVFLFAAAGFSMLVRFTALLVLAVIAPLALACHALPHTDPLARLWWRGFAGCLAVPLLQAFTLQAGRQVLLNPGAILPSLGLPNDPFNVINMMVVIVLLWTTVKIPTMVRRYTAQPGNGGPNVLGVVVRVAAATRGVKAVLR